MSQRSSKICQNCGESFPRNPKHSRSQWEGARFCGTSCSNKSRATHNARQTRLYSVWAGIKQRCFNPSFHLYKEYGGRGIGMAQEWIDGFTVFAKDVGPDPGPRYELGRKDNDLGYSKNNCQWEMHKHNMRNTRRTHWVNYLGKTISLAEACEMAGSNYKKTWLRLKNGWSLMDALR